MPPALQRILIVTDAWEPQVNGVVRTMRAVTQELRRMGYEVEVIGPDRFRTIPCPTYASIRLAVLPRHRLTRMIEAFGPEALHISTEGPLGASARRWALRHEARFTTAYHTRFPEYLAARTGLSPALPYALLRRFHGAGSGMMVATESLCRDLAAKGFHNIRRWSRGVNLELFRLEPRHDWGLPGPVFLTVGRIAVEKNLSAFLDLDLPGSKVVVGDGPQLAALRRRHPDVHFAGALHGAALARAYAGGDVFVFPSLTDTFGLVLLEALACGTPVAAFPVTGPVDVLNGAGNVGALDHDLRAACLRALQADRAACRAHAGRFSWQACAERFVANLVPLKA
jgi:glycosyltransferase involved in cell wall biosynthesis